jgi:hypothetical protein
LPLAAIELAKAEQLSGLVIGAWSGELYDHTPAEIVEALVVAMPQLRALFIGDISSECEQVAATFPRALYVGWDVLVTPGFQRAYVLEGNAFGDFLPNVPHQGSDQPMYSR